ncbi:MAG TPA: GGDEF domain-containing protein [Edaphobacter sp.]|jgi:diguanylate cyclase (GGDEF)-like protein|nr:GGDEF domain-containing protein [Edaphobacter sp.]
MTSLRQTVKAQILRFSGLGFIWLTFPQPLEDRFESDTIVRRCARLWLEGLFAIILFNLFLIADHLGAPAQFNRALLIRAGIITPLALCVNISMLFHPRRIFRETSIAFVACLAGITHLFIESNVSPVASAYAPFGILAVVLFAHISMRLRFPYTLAITSVMVFAYVVFLHYDTFLHPNEKIFGLFLILCTVFITVVANYTLNRDERLAYLHHLHDNVLVDDLNRSNEQLLQIAQSDALTGLANRHSFNQRFEQYWRDGFTQSSPLSLILVDLDNFKHINDTYGHLYGDQVLKRIAHLLLESLRIKGDFAARFGGEEFVILLPSTTQTAAIQVAERIRKLIEVAGLPPFEQMLTTFNARSFTVSCGVATRVPQSPGGPRYLLEIADKALYEAKASGRNCVCCAPTESAIV